MCACTNRKTSTPSNTSIVTAITDLSLRPLLPLQKPEIFSKTPFADEGKPKIGPDFASE